MPERKSVAAAGRIILPDTLAADGNKFIAVGCSYPDYPITDLAFGIPFLDQVEWRSEPRPHLYIHGGFTGTETLFSFYFPPHGSYRGRILQYLEGGSGGSEMAVQAVARTDSSWQYELAFDELGACLIESNQGHTPRGGMGLFADLELFGASAETARFARWLAQGHFGERPHHIYVWGGSGGGVRTIHCITRAPDVYDGGVPQIMGDLWTAAIVGTSVSGLASDLLTERDILEIADALEPGGDGNPFKRLSVPQREAVADLLRMGCPRQAIGAFRRLSTFPFSLFTAKQVAKSFFDDFWTKPGFEGHDTPERLKSRIVLGSARVTAIGIPGAAERFARLTTSMGGGQAEAAALRLDYGEPGNLFMAKLTVLSGAAAGRELLVANVIDGYLVPFLPMAPALTDGIEPGDEIAFDNRDWVAFTHLYRYAAEGRPRAPDNRLFPSLAADGASLMPEVEITSFLGGLPRFPNKMILMPGLSDIHVWPIAAVRMHRDVEALFGPKSDEHFRLWWIDRAAHGPPSNIASMFNENEEIWRTRLTSCEGFTAQSIVDLMEWVENGKIPAATTSYTLSRDNAVMLHDTAEGRGGLQPVVRVRVNGKQRAVVKPDEALAIHIEAETPPGGGDIVGLAWTSEETDSWTEISLPDAAPKIAVEVAGRYMRTGTFRLTVRARAHRQGANGGALRIIENKSSVLVRVLE